MFFPNSTVSSPSLWNVVFLQTNLFSLTLTEERLTEQLLKSKVAQMVPSEFDDLANEIFLYQYRNNPIYRQFCDSITTLAPWRKPPFYLPISAFKSNRITTADVPPTHFFESSGTTGSTNSRHYINDVEFYLQMSMKGFENQYGSLSNYCILALLPHYLERQHSSLVEMVRYFITKSEKQQSGFFLNETKSMFQILQENKRTGIPTILFGVSFALLDFVAEFKLDFPELIVMETGGMKGRREEMTRSELHFHIKKGFNIQNVHSEYGMTELLSQAWSKGEGIFTPSQTMKISIMEATDPFEREKPGKTGVIHVTDLANIETCSFIATEDLGIDLKNGNFLVQGRLDQADIRGCNLMIV